MRPSSSYAALRKGGGEEGKQQSNGAEKKGQTRIKEARSIARTLCVGYPVAARRHILRCTSLQLHLNCTPTLPAALSHGSQRPSSSLCPAHGPTGGGKGSLMENAEGGRDGRAGLDWTGFVCGWECHVPSQTHSFPLPTLLQNPDRWWKFLVGDWLSYGVLCAAATCSGWFFVCVLNLLLSFLSSFTPPLLRRIGFFCWSSICRCQERGG